MHFLKIALFLNSYNLSCNTETKSAKDYPESFLLIIADVIRDGKLVRIEFITGNFNLQQHLRTV